MIRTVHANDRRKTHLEVSESGLKIIKDVQKIVKDNRKIALEGYFKRRPSNHE